MRELKSLLNSSARMVQLESPGHGVVTSRLASLPDAAPSVQHTIILNLEDIPVVCEFPDMFPGDLHVMLLDRDVEFTIELQPGTAPISRRPYKMTPKKLSELKV
jgi:hypothetical protein